MIRFYWLCLTLLAAPAYAALPPAAQNHRDLATLTAFIEQHGTVAATLRFIDLENHTIHFGNDCKAVFSRKKTFHLPGWAGPAAALKLRTVNCDIGATKRH